MVAFGVLDGIEPLLRLVVILSRAASDHELDQTGQTLANSVTLL